MKRFLTCLLVTAGLFLAQGAWAAPAAQRKAAAPPAAPAHVAAAATSATGFAHFLAGFIPCPLCSPRIPCPRCP